MIKQKTNYYKFEDFELSSGNNISLELSYQVFGLNIQEGPVVVVNHSLTGDSNVSGNSGWWNKNGLEQNILSNINKISNQKIRKKMSIIGQKNIDGKGTYRIADSIIKYFS